VLAAELTPRLAAELVGMPQLTAQLGDVHCIHQISDVFSGPVQQREIEIERVR